MITIEQECWDLTPEGEAVIRYRMRNSHGSEVELTNLGAAVVAIRVPDREGRMADVALGYANASDYFRDPANMGKSIGRFAGRIGYGRLEIEGEEYRLEANCGRHHLHGGSKGFANQLWESRVEENRVVMELFSPEGDQGYPAMMQAEVVFDFDDDNSLEITYRAASDRTTVVNLTNHLYFNLEGESSGSILDHELQLNASRVCEMNGKQLPTGRMVEVADTVMDFSEFRPLRPGLESDFNHLDDYDGFDHPFAVEDWQPNILREVGRLRSPRSGREMLILSSQPCVVVYTGNGLSGGSPRSKSGRRYEDYDGIALECQNFPDAPNRPEFPSPLLHAGEIYCQKTVYRFSTF